MDDQGSPLAGALVASEYFEGGETGDFSGCSGPCFELFDNGIQHPIAFNCSLDGHVKVVDQFIAINSAEKTYDISVEMKVFFSLLFINSY